MLMQDPKAELVEVFVQSSTIINQAREVLRQAGEVRAHAVVALHKHKLTQQEIGDLVGISGQRVSQLMSRAKFNEL